MHSVHHHPNVRFSRNNCKFLVEVSRTRRWTNPTKISLATVVNHVWLWNAKGLCPIGSFVSSVSFNSTFWLPMTILKNATFPRKSFDDAIWQVNYHVNLPSDLFHCVKQLKTTRQKRLQTWNSSRRLRFSVPSFFTSNFVVFLFAAAFRRPRSRVAHNSNNVA